jgi:hypothetical protein
MRPTINFSAAILLMVSVIGFAHLRSRQVLRREVEQAARREGSLPKRILWIWERPEDLRELDPSSTGIAVLEETLHLGYSMTPVARHQAILRPDRTARIAVVRIETDQRFAGHKDDSALRRAAVADLRTMIGSAICRSTRQRRCFSGWSRIDAVCCWMRLPSIGFASHCALEAWASP